jgi:chorismate-pyruvate lyase
MGRPVFVDAIVMGSKTGPLLSELYRLFDETAEVPKSDLVPEDTIPQPYRHLLVHSHHMTVTVEEFYGGPVNVRVLARRRYGNSYARKILLEVAATGHVVQFGIVRIRLDQCAEPVRDEILSETTPLGRILIEHDVLRRIEPTAYLQMRTDPELTTHFGLKTPSDAWGRLALIYCDGQPAIELLEILAPIP